MSKVEVSLQFAGDLFVPGEFLAVVRSDRVHLLSVWFKQPDHCLADCKCGLAFNLLNQCEARLALNDAHNGLTMILANDGIRFPVTYPTACLDDGGPIIDGNPIGYSAAPLHLTVMLLS